MAEVRIDIASEFKEAGFKKAQKSTDKLNKSFDGLARQARRTFIAIAGFQALKKSVQAFIAEDKAAVKLAQSLRNLGLAYNTSAIEDYLEKTEKATAISKDELSPAITQLISTTLDAKQSMQLLSVAMDISASTGKDLGSVTTALSRAYNGNYASLGKLQTAYTTAELEAMGFNTAITTLSRQFAGSAAANADSYAGKVELLKIAFGDASEELGKGIIGGLEQLNNGNYTKGLEAIVKIGGFIGDVFRRAGLTIRYTKELLSTGFRIDEEERRKLEEIRALFDNPMAAANRTANNPAANRKFLADMKKQQDLQKKIELDRKKAAALAAKTEKERAKREKEALQLKRAGTVFDLENIQIIAALQNRVTEENRLRLTALLAIQNENADAADKLTQAVLLMQSPMLNNLGITVKTGDNATDVINKIINAQTKLFLLNTGIANLPKAKNPFEDWDTILDRLLGKINAIKNAINGFGSGNGGGNGAGGSGGGGSAGGGNGGGGGGSGTGITANPTDPAGVSIITGNGTANPFDTFNVGGATIIANSGVVLSGKADDTPNEAAARQRIADIFETIGTFGPQGFQATNVTVNVAGNVMSNDDLIQVITEGLYEVQKRGQSITLNAVAL